MILVTGASGKTGQALTRQLARRGAAVRAMTREPAGAQALLALGAQEAVLADFADRAALRRALDGVEGVYHICPNMHPAELEIGTALLAASREAGVGLFGYHSVLHPQASAMPHHWNKLRVEEQIHRSGMEFVILQPTAYMQNIQAYWGRILREGVYALPYAPETRLSLVDLEDAAEAAAEVLLNPRYRGGSYELVGTPALSQTGAAQEISRALRKPVRVEAQDRGEWEAQARAGGMPEYALQTLLKMFEYYEAHGMWGSSTVLESILKRPPVSFGEFVTRMAASV